MRGSLKRVLLNTTSLLGIGLALITFGLILLLFLIEFTSSQQHPYMGIITFVILPIFLNLGLLMIVVGAVRTMRRRRLTGNVEEPLPHIDLNRPHHRRALFLFFTGGVLFLAISAFGSYQAYEYTDSVEFCGTTCHKVMKPEYVAYKASPHARVTCVQCHIGPGATWYVRSKFSGAYQVYSTLFNKYPRPIHTPIKDLRPAKETCEQCHWPRHFHSAKMRGEAYFASDEKNTKSEIGMLVKIGGGNSASGVTEGIHAHMYLNNEIRYVALDRERNNIPYVESRNADGTVTVYRSMETPITDAQIRRGEKRLVDCIECHNRPTHIFHHPAKSVNMAMEQGRIDPSLPEIKRVAVEELQKPYKTEREALSGLQRSITDFYQKSYPQVASSKQGQIEGAVREIQGIYKLNFFPEMKVSWKAFPNHIGHMYSPGCFRCHDGKHKSDTGRVISKDCNVCHTIVSQKVGPGKPQVSLDGMAFRHPVEIGDAWKETPCSDCHAPSE